MTYETKQVAPPQEIQGELPLLSQRVPAEARAPGLSLECPLCTTSNPTYVHPVDVRGEQRGAIYGSDTRFVANILLGCEAGGHYFILEITNRKGELNMGLRTPYDRELMAEWQNGSFDNWVHSDTVRFSEKFEVSPR